MEAVQSAEWVGGTWMGVLKGSGQHLGASTSAETPLSSESGGAAFVGWKKGREEAEEEVVEGLGIVGGRRRTAAAAVGRSVPVGEEEEEGQWSA